MTRRGLVVVAALAAAATVAVPAIAASYFDFGRQTERGLAARSEQLFGVDQPLAESAPETTGQYRQLDQPASDQVRLADGLSASYATREAGNATDMMAWWPSDTDPTHLFTAVETDEETTADGKAQPSVQRIELSTGEVTVVLRGLISVDPIRRTAWGTIIAGEETDDGGLYEIIDPLEVTEAVVTDRDEGVVTMEDLVTPEPRVAKRPATGTKAWEGIGLLPSGVIYMGDELRPGDAGFDRDGGAIFRFLPDQPYTGTDPIVSLGESPLAAGRNYALVVSSYESSSSDFPATGQGAEVGNGAWVKVDAATARDDADANGATGYYRPEDLEMDPLYSGAGARFCWTNTQREAAKSYAEVMCAVDDQPEAGSEQVLADGLTYLAQETGELATATVVRFIEGGVDFNSFDNLDFQPISGILYVVEDHENGDIWACLPDGIDGDQQSDGCIKVLSVRDSSAEPTGLLFSADGQRAYLTIQHSDDEGLPLVHGYPTDDILVIEGFGAPQAYGNVTAEETEGVFIP